MQNLIDEIENLSVQVFLTTVYDILEYLAGGITEEEILEDFCELTNVDIKACLAFAADREKKLFVASPPIAFVQLRGE